MAGLSCTLLVVACAVYVLAIPASLLTDVKQAEQSNGQARLSNKVKRAQEVIMFGNQQNRGGDGRTAFNVPHPEKRGAGGVDMDDNVMLDTPTDDTTVEEPKALPLFDRDTLPATVQESPYAQRLHNSLLKPDYFSDPAVLSGLRYYDLDERRKREAYRTPSKRFSRGLIPTGRSKRDLEIDPEELFTLLAYLEKERHNSPQKNRNMYNPYNLFDVDDLDMMDANEVNEINDGDEPIPEAWMEGPIAMPARHFSAPGDAWGHAQRFPEDRRKRFMVSKRRSQEGDMYALSQLFNGPPQRDVDAAGLRRYIF